MARIQDPDPQRRWAPDGQVREMTLEGVAIAVEVRDEAAKIDLNNAPPDLLAGLFEQLGEARGAAGRAFRQRPGAGGDGPAAPAAGGGCRAGIRQRHV